MSQVPLAQPPSSGNGPFDRWVYLLWKRVSSAGQLLWSYLDFTGSNITDIETRNHDDLQNINTADHYHLTQANHTDLTDGGESILHYHDSDRLWTNFNFTGSNITDIVTRNHDDLQNLNTANHYHLTQANHTDLTDGGDSTLHYHASDRARANHTGTQESETVLVDRINGPTYSTLQDFINLSQSAGQITGGVIASAGGNLVNVSAGTGWLRIADDNVSPLVFFDWSALNGINIPTNTSRFIGVEYNSGSPQIVVKTVDTWDEDTEFQLGEVINDNDVIHIVNDPWWVADSVTNIIQRFTSIQQIQRDNAVGGLIVGETGTRNITVSAGRLWSRLNDYDYPAIDTSGSDTFDAYYRNGSGGFTRIAAQTQWPNTQYDDGTGVLATLGSNKYAVLWWYAETDGDLVMVYGREQHNNASDAELESVPDTLPERLSKSAVLAARLVFNEGDATALFISSAFSTVFTTIAASNHNALSGLQGGTTGEYYHLTAAQVASLGVPTADILAFAASHG